MCVGDGGGLFGGTGVGGCFCGFGLWCCGGLGCSTGGWFNFGKLGWVIGVARLFVSRFTGKFGKFVNRFAIVVVVGDGASQFCRIVIGDCSCEESVCASRDGVVGVRSESWIFWKEASEKWFKVAVNPNVCILDVYFGGDK